MKTCISPINFKGYDAAILKNIYLERANCAPYLDEMGEISKKEGIHIKTEYDFRPWMQDSKMFVSKDTGVYLAANGTASDNFLQSIEYAGTKASREYGFIVGGNVFTGKFPTGEKWLIVGMGNYSSQDAWKKDVSEVYGVKSENIFGIPQQNFHLDMFLRPVGYPYILVNNFDCVLENLEKISDSNDEFNYLKRRVRAYIKSMSFMYSSFEETKEALSSHGFQVIPMALCYDGSVNYANAIVNLHQNGTISYITNSSKCKNPYYTKLQELFEADLRKSCPNVDKVYFVTGRGGRAETNFMMDTLEYNRGGIHCLSLEEPNFDLWG